MDFFKYNADRYVLCPSEVSLEIALAIMPPEIERSGITAVRTSDNFHPVKNT